MRKISSTGIIVGLGVLGFVKDLSNYANEPELTLLGFFVTTGIPMFVNLTLIATGLWLWFDDSIPPLRTFLPWVLGIAFVFVFLEGVMISHQQVRGVEIANPRQTLLNGFIRGALVGTLISLYADRRRLAVRQRRQLQEQNERLEDFARIVSHDLRNPLSVAQGRRELLAEDVDSEHLEPMGRAHERMETLIEDLLALAKQGASVSDPESVRLSELVRDCWVTIDTGAATLETDLDGVVRADRSRLKQLFENLIRNAIEHGGRGVTITVGTTTDGFFVADDGDGIPDEERPELFEAGYSTNDGGTGFGLTIVEEVADAHGWTVSVTESEDGGARFDITGVEFE